MNLREFQEWAIEQKSVGNPTEEQSYKGECVSLVQQYLSKVFNMPFKARGNAKDWVNNIPEGFKKLGNSIEVTYGDILVYTTGRFGHMAIVSVEKKSLEQNKNGDKIITLGDISKGYECILRPENGVDIGENSDYKVNLTYKTQVALKVRKGPGTDFEQKNKAELTADGQKNAYEYTSAVLKAGTKVTLLEEKQIGNNEVWGRIPSGWIAFKYDGKDYVK